jgi:hypothetical protein
MSATQAQCPSCASTISFGISASCVAVCPACRSLVARTDRAIEFVGKVADLAETRSPLKLGLTGQYMGAPFRLVGRVQIRHLLGGVWDEWYAAFGDRRWGWLAEAMGRFFLSFPEPPPARPPSFGELGLGRPAPRIKTGQLIVAEKALGEFAAAEGELPVRFTPGERYEYADLSGPGGQFGTIDYSHSPPLLFVGREVTLEELGLGRAGAREAAVKTVSAKKLACPHCGGALELRAPDQSERVACPYCASLLDVKEGDLVYLKTLTLTRHQPILPLGSSAEFDGLPMTIIGFMVRSCRVEGTWYPWQEYLLYHPQRGFRWLVRSDDHWTYVRAIPPGEVRAENGRAWYENQRFKCFQQAPARVDYVAGEFYWRVEAGEQAETADYVRAPRMLSREVMSYKAPGQKEGTLGEVSWSLAEYVPVSEVRNKFRRPELPRPSTVGPCQPFPHKGVYRVWGWLSLAALALAALVYLVGPRRPVLEQTFEFPPLEKADGSQALFAEPFELEAHSNVCVEAASTVENGWVFLQGSLNRVGTSDNLNFTVPIEHYRGVQDGEPWEQGGDSQCLFISAPPPGQYSLRLEASHQDWQKPLVVRVTIRQGVPHAGPVVVLLVALAALPVLVFLRGLGFEKSRWEESMYG